jgi:glycylpeptide N-tetradecanoyltransferase
VQVRHWLLPRPGVIDSFVVEDPETRKVTDFVSYYALPSTIIGNDQYKLLKAAYCYYHVARSVPLKQLMNDALIMVRVSSILSRSQTDRAHLTSKCCRESL